MEDLKNTIENHPSLGVKMLFDLHTSFLYIFMIQFEYVNKYRPSYTGRLDDNFQSV